MIGAVLLGNTLVDFGASASPRASSSVVGHAASPTRRRDDLLVVVFAEVLPKTMPSPCRTAWRAVVARPMLWVVVAARPADDGDPAAWSALMLRPFGMRLDDDSRCSRPPEEIRGQIELQHEEGGGRKAERDMLGGVLDLATSGRRHHGPPHQDADDQRRPAAAGVVASCWRAIHAHAALAGTPENIVGVLHAKDLLRALDAGRDADKLDIEAIALEPWFVPDTTS